MQLSQLAINSVSTTQKGLIEALDAYAAAGFSNVEFVLPLLKDWLKYGHSVAEAREVLAERGLRAIGGFETHLDCFSAPEKQHANHDIQLANARLIDELGGGVLVVGTDGPPQPSLEALDTVAAVIRDLARLIEGLHVQLAIEFNWSPLVKSLKSAVLVAEKVDHPQVGILFDTAHYYTTTTKFEHLTAQSVPLIKHVHINDMRDKPGELSNCNSDRILPGRGILDLHTCISALEQHGYRGYYSLELFNDELWQLSCAEAANLCYQSLLPLCQPNEVKHND